MLSVHFQPVVGDLPLHGIDEVGHATVIHIPNAFVEPGVDVPVGFVGLHIEVPVAHRNRDIRRDSAFLDRRQQIVERVPITADLGPRRQGGQAFLKKGQVQLSELSTGAVNSKVMSLCPESLGACYGLGRKSHWNEVLRLARFPAVSCFPQF